MQHYVQTYRYFISKESYRNKVKYAPILHARHAPAIYNYIPKDANNKSRSLVYCVYNHHMQVATMIIKRIHVSIVIGTRPEAIKCAPVILDLKADTRFSVSVLNTGQHKDMLEQALHPFNIVPDILLGEMQHDSDICATIAHQILPLAEQIRHDRPDILLVQGDTSTALAATVTAYYEKIPVGHIEAGLRSNNLYSPFPEEGNRKVISALATLHFAPTETARDALLREHVPAQHIFVTGNTVVDSLLYLADHGREVDAILGQTQRQRPIILITAHRRETWGARLKYICEAILQLSQRYPTHLLVFPVHKNPIVHDAIFSSLQGKANICLLESLEYLDFISLLRASTLVLTDSGGIQEEAPSFGVPVLVLRDITERPEAVDAGLARLVGTDTTRIVSETTNIIDNPEIYKGMAQAKNPFGDGQAAKRIRHILLNWHAARTANQ